jgi:ABC-2 type transport system ATP-binding protein
VSIAAAVSELAPALAAEGLGKRFGRRQALRDVSFAAAAGELLAVIGPNGAGKTTLLSILAGLQRPDAGRVSVAPRDVGWVPQQPAVYRRLSVAENLRLFARLERIPDVDAAVDRALELTGLRERAHEMLARLSGGNRQRVNLAVGLLADPPALLLDEPSAALDPRQREVLWGVVARLGRTVVFSTHDVAEAERHADRLLVLADGELLFAGTATELRRAAGDGAGDLEAAFVRFLHARGH